MRLWFGILVANVYAVAQPARPSLHSGVIQFMARNGTRSEIQIGKRCADLWVAPDESVIAFIGIEKAAFGTENDAPRLLTRVVSMSRVKRMISSR